MARRLLQGEGMAANWATVDGHGDRRACSEHAGRPESSEPWDERDVLSGPRGCFLKKATSARAGNVTEPPDRDRNRTRKIRGLRTIFQVKEQVKTPGEELSEVEISSLPPQKRVQDDDHKDALEFGRKRDHTV